MSRINGASAGSLITKQYNNFRGVDFSGKDVSNYRSPDSKNMWKNHSNLGKGIETRPDIEKIINSELTIYGIFFYKVDSVEHMIIHAGVTLIDYNTETNTQTIIKASGMNLNNSNSFIYNNILYIKDGLNFLEYNGETLSNVCNNAYIPTTTIGKSPNGKGTVHEDANMLTGKRKNSFKGNGTDTVFQLDVETLTSQNVRVWIEDTEITTGFTANVANGTVTFTTAPAKPISDGEDNVVIEFEKTKPLEKEKILKCNTLCVFDNRVFFSENQDYPNMLWHSSLNEPRYISDTDYYNEGLDFAKVKAMIPGNNALWTLKEPSQANTSIFYHNPSLDAERGKVYPSIHSSISIGCIGKGINFNDDIVFFSYRGMEGITGDINSEQAVSHRSSLIDSKLLKEGNYKNMLLTEWNGYLLVFIDNKVYLADSQNMFQYGNHYEYEWFYWELSITPTSVCVKDDILYLGTINGVYTLTKNTGVTINSYWCTPKDDLGYSQLCKSANKRGCTIDLTGRYIDVYTKTDNNEFILLKSFINTKNYIVPSIRNKKFKDIQLKIMSNEPFSIENICMEIFLGSYLKR